MSISKQRWKKAVSATNEYKLQGRNSNLSTISKTSINQESTGEDEVDLYLSRLKEKAGVRRLWSGRKFSDVIDDDKTPDISISSDDDEAINAMDFNRIKLDSDEDELRIDYLRDANNNKIEDDENEVISESLDLMNNIHFAELDFGEVNLSDTDERKDIDDFLPNVYTVNFSGSEKEMSDKDGSNTYSYDAQNNVKFMTGIKPIIKSDDDKLASIPNQIKIMKADSPVSNSPVSNSLVSDSKAETLSSGNKYSVSIDYTTTTESSEYSDDFTSATSKTKTKSRHRVSTTSQFRRRRKSKGRNRTESSTKSTPSTSDLDTIFSTSSISTDSHSSRTSHTKEKLKNSKGKLKTKSSRSQKSIQIQTDHIPNTNDILNFKYPWQQDKPHNIASHVIDGESLHVLTSYEPSVLAAHDLMKYHFKLLQQHIDNSRRLYESYVNETSSNNFKYTTVEDTFSYILRNKPKVISYKDALNEIRLEEG